MENGLWYSYVETTMDFMPDGTNTRYKPIINRLSSTGMYELLHAPLGHPGTKTMADIHHHIDGVPKLRPPPLHRCSTCMLMKSTKRAITTQQLQQSIKPNPTPISKEEQATHDLPAQQSAPKMPSADSLCQSPNLTEEELDKMDLECAPGERFHMDMGFVRGTKYKMKDEDGRIVTSLDGYNSYLLIIDRAT